MRFRPKYIKTVSVGELSSLRTQGSDASSQFKRSLTTELNGLLPLPDALREELCLTGAPLLSPDRSCSLAQPTSPPGHEKVPTAPSSPAGSQQMPGSGDPRPVAPAEVPRPPVLAMGLGIWIIYPDAGNIIK